MVYLPDFTESGGGLLLFPRLPPDVVMFPGAPEEISLR